jgi:protein-disulfide isomerase
MSQKSEQRSIVKQLKYEQERKQKRMQRMVWIIVGIVIVLIAATVAFSKINSTSADFTYGNLPVLGDSNAPIKIVEFGDYKCPSCQFFSQNIAPQLKKDYIDTGKVALYFMNYTIIGPDSTTAALAAQSVFHQNNDSYWKYYDALYKKQGNERVQWATPDFLTELARTENIGVDLNKLKQDIASKTYQSEIDAHNRLAKSKGVTGTPTLFLNGVKMDDKTPFDYKFLKAAVDKELAGVSSK